MNIFGKTFGLLVGLALIAVLGWAAWLGLERRRALRDAGRPGRQGDRDRLGVVLVAAAIISSAVRNRSAKSEVTHAREQKTGVYQFFVECWQDPATASHRHIALDRLLALHGGAAVIKAHMALRAIAREKGAAHPDTAAQLGNALLEIRRDLGGSAAARGIGAGELQQLILGSQAPFGAHAVGRHNA